MSMQLTFPSTFLWGAATVAHQVEGSNVYNDNWVLEHVPGTPYVEPSGDACDHYHRYRDDIALLAGLGFTLYRFSQEWSRIEPVEGEFSLAQLDHYRRMLADGGAHAPRTARCLPPGDAGRRFHRRADVLPPAFRPTWFTGARSGRGT